MRLAGAALLALGLGMATGLGFQPIGWWWATILGFAGFVALLRDTQPRRAFGLGYLYGLGYFGMTVWYVANFGWWAPVLLVGFLGLWAGLVGWATAWLVSHGPDRVVKMYPVFTACAWTGSEWLAQRMPFGGFCWSRFVYTVADQPLGGLLPVIGAGPVSFLVALTGSLVALLMTSHSWRRRLVTGGSILALMLGGGALTLWPAPEQGETVSVGMIQGNVDSTADAFSMGHYRSVTAMHLSQTIIAMATWRANGTRTPEILIWPENSTDTDPAYDDHTLAMVTQASNLAGLPMLIGIIALGPGDYERQTSALLWLPGEGPVARVDKRNLAPFGEFVPYYEILGTIVPKTQLVGRQSVPGEGPGVVEAAIGGQPLVIGNIICYELVYDQTVYDTVRHGARLLTVQSSNVSFVGTWQPPEQWAITRVRAMELRRWMVVTTTASLSGLIDPHGRVVDITTPFTGAFRLYDVPLGDNIPPGLVIGPWLEGGVSVLGASGVLLGFVWRHRRRIQLRHDTDTTRAGDHPHV